jgi:GNAT superfamily N-acetyltransferase/DNA-binding MarR family transcriptional regulator
MTRDGVDEIRRFHRTVGEVIGVTADRFLGRKRPPGESRLLWEIGIDGVDVRLLRRRLGLDSGYVSRVLQSLARQRLVRVRVDARDRRQRRAVLTRRGIAERSYLDRRSDGLAAGVLEPLSAAQRQRLIAAVAEVERLLRASMIRFEIADPTASDAQFCLSEYFRELNARFTHGFDPARSISADAKELTRPRGVLLVAFARERPVGCGALKFHEKAPAELKRMWIDPAWRGMGLGARLLRELERHARTAGVRRVRLETNDALREAIALYRQAGYVEVDAFNDEPYADHWFEKRLSPAVTGAEKRRASQVMHRPTIRGSLH